MKSLKKVNLENYSGGDFITGFCAVTTIAFLVAPNPVSGGLEAACGIYFLLFG